VATVIPIEELRKSETAALFQGGDDIPVSIFVTEHPRGKGAALHFHPYPEAFVVQSGTAVFTVGDEQVTVEGGHFVVVPAETPHGFEAASDDPLRIVSVHPSPKVVQTWL
jgi:mannose-6-phosphate isomerase-like protein (cupin superfamily)